MRLSALMCFVAAAAVLASAQPASAHGRGRCGGGAACASGCDTGCGTACAAPAQPQYQTVERTIMVPTWVDEVRTVNVVECRAEQREQTYTVNKCVAETRAVTHNYTVMVPETRTRTVNYTVCKPVMNQQTQEYTVMVPYTETVQGTRRVCQMVAVNMTRNVCVDEGHWEEVACAPACGASNGGGCGRRRCRACCNSGCDTGCGDVACAAPVATRKVWVPNMVTKQVQYTCMRPQWSEVPCEYQVTKCRAETRTRTVNVCSMVREQQSKEVQYTVCVPQERSCTRNVVEYRTVPETQTRTVTVNVPYTVQKQVTVKVCKMVPQTVTCQVPVGGCDQAACGGGGCGRRRCR